MGSGKATEAKAKPSLFDDDSGSDSDAGAGSEIKINTEFAKRFEHNKKREEKQRLEEKFKREGRSFDDDDDEDSESSSDETEDEEGFLATEALDAEISAALNAIRNKDPRIYDKNVKFYTEKTEGADANAKPKEKPLYLKDFHREQYLKGAVDVSDKEDNDEDVPMTYNQEQDALKKSIVSSIHAVGKDKDEDSDSEEFLKRKTPKAEKLSADGVHPSRKVDTKPAITEKDVATANENPELFLSNFMASRAWVPPDGSNWEAFESDDGASDADERAEAIEHAYNMRFEDPEKSNEVLTTYARDLVNSRSVRREEVKGRKRQRELERQRREEEKQQRREEKARLKKLKLEEMQTKLDQIRKTAGAWGKELSEEELLKFLSDTWSDNTWEDEMKKRFGDDYYAQQDDEFGNDDEDEDIEEVEEGGKKSKKPKKPTWDDDIDISKIVGDISDVEEAPAREFTVADLEDSNDEVDAEEEAEQDNEDDDDEDDDSRPSKKRKTSRDHKKDRAATKKAAKTERSKLSALVDMHMDLDDPDTLALPSRRKKTRAGPAFRYRETSPNAYGLTARDVLLAPSDTALKKFASLKKYAEWRLPEQKEADARRLGKKARLRKWRREVFGRDFEKSGPTYGFAELFNAEEEKQRELGGKKKRDGSEDDVKVKKSATKDEKEDGKKKKRRAKKKSKAVEA
ncbi:hypothetical protein TD95_002455 [Thielaviopsis punctulata]|uniref:Kri1-like C-terminal domain-containing protein n=1 Tax=Thielaviopsis punctulata TaxID=72032 RepID=A0A0F4Z8I0_9PEZI|nr:hypothetical protein TD95_002455 [Thielaviopsis punctulata]